MGGLHRPGSSRWHPALAPSNLSGPASHWLRADLGPHPVDQEVGSGHHDLLVSRGWRSTCEAASSGPHSSWTRPWPGSCGPDPCQPWGPRLRTQPHLGFRQESCSAILAADRRPQNGAGFLHGVGGLPPPGPWEPGDPGPAGSLGALWLHSCSGVQAGGRGTRRTGVGPRPVRQVLTGARACLS